MRWSFVLNYGGLVVRVYLNADVYGVENLRAILQLLEQRIPCYLDLSQPTVIHLKDLWPLNEFSCGFQNI